MKHLKTFERFSQIEVNEGLFGPSTEKQNELINKYNDDIVSGKFAYTNDIQKLIDKYLKDTPKFGGVVWKKGIDGLIKVMTDKSNENLPDNLKLQIARVVYKWAQIVIDKDGMYITGKVAPHGTGGASNASMNS